MVYIHELTERAFLQSINELFPKWQWQCWCYITVTNGHNILVFYQTFFNTLARLLSNFGRAACNCFVAVK